MSNLMTAVADPKSRSEARGLLLLQRHPLATFFVLAYAISWAFMFPVAASAQGLVSWQIPFSIYYLGSFGPMLSALAVTGLTTGASGIRALLGRIAKWRVGWGYVAFTVLGPMVFFAVAAIVGRVLTGRWPDWYLLGEADYLPYLGLAGVLALWLLTYGLGEEVGWRGFALPHLQRGHSALSAALILGVLWAFWHLPAFFFRDTYVEMGPVGFPIFFVSLACASTILAWLYNSTGGSLLMVILFHAFFNWLSVSEAGGPYVAIIMGAAAVFWAIRVVKLYGPENLAPVTKQVE